MELTGIACVLRLHSSLATFFMAVRTAASPWVVAFLPLFFLWVAWPLDFSVGEDVALVALEL